MSEGTDVCLIVEGGYPYALGGVSSWVDSLIRASPQLRFSVVAISISAQPRAQLFPAPENLISVSDVILDACSIGRVAQPKDTATIDYAVDLIQAVLTTGSAKPFTELIALIKSEGFGGSALLDSRQAWTAMEGVYDDLLPNGPLVDFFWSWRFLARSLLAVISHPLPDAKVFHAVSTGYAGLVGAYARQSTDRPYALTEHGIYTNERRIELSVADWIFNSCANGFDTAANLNPELKHFWLTSFNSFSRISYETANVITTQYAANQNFQRADGACATKLRIIPNGIDIDRYGQLPMRITNKRLTVLMIARIVPIKDIRTFIAAVGRLKELVPDVAAIIVGPEDEDRAYAQGCRELASQLGLSDILHFAGRVLDVKDYLAIADVIALTSISEAQPIALLEAAATGLPAVATDVGSCREIIEGFNGDPVIGQGGIVVEACNPVATANALATILRDDRLRAEMGSVMRRRIPNLYHKERIRLLYEALYRELEHQSGPGRASRDYRAQREG